MSKPVNVMPMDAYNARLVEAVHPPTWVNPKPTGVYDMLVIGAGTAGLVTAIACRGFGKRVALIERHLMGGDCLNVGCVPSKALIRAARAAAEVRDAEKLGVKISGYAVDFPAVMERMRKLRAEIAPHDGAKRFASLGIDVFLGDAKFEGPDSVSVGGTTLEFHKACIATGGRPAAPDMPGLASAGYLTNETIFTLTELPARLAVIGAGPIGCEMAQAFARFGSQVTLITTDHGVLPHEEPAASAIVRASLHRDGVTIHEGGRHARIETHGPTKRIVLGSNVIDVDAILLAAGRRPNVEGLGLERAGVDYDPRGVKVDDHLRTTNRRIFAAGDICFPYKFTHAADACARIVTRNAMLPWLPFAAKASKLVMPWCTYTDPEVARVGRSALELTEAGVDIETVTIEMGEVDRAMLDEQTKGVLIVHVKRRSGRILGATLVSAHAGETIGELTAAMTHGLTLQSLSKVIHPYPTQAEAIKRAGDAYFRILLLRWRDRLTHLFSGKSVK
ncbi:MAG: FAD-containing oxidoreductase [Planctomycetes bacterium]|nr:FAD-containing oxidoreductase [Planctomycetota bacterium]